MSMKTIQTEPNGARRFTATFIDYFVIFFFTGIYMLVFSTNATSGDDTIEAVHMIVPFLFWFFWLVISEWKYGTTFGHWATKLKIVTKKGGRPNLLQSFLRRLTDPIEILVCLGIIAYFFVVTTDHNQRLGDLISGTLVIDHKADYGDEWFDFEKE